jgi:methylated-DNA-[protein]-cysteine S-methyltransferase
MLNSATLKTPIGDLNLIVEENILLAAGFKSLDNLIGRLAPADANQEIRQIAKIPIISELISEYFDGNLSAINPIKVRQPGAKFSQEAWKAMRRIPAGKTISYAELAKRAGSADAIRAAGTACGNNLIAPIIPCHRIIKSGGGLGNYGYGIKVKEWLLTHEGAI